MTTRNRNAGSIATQVALVSALALCLFGTVQADGLTLAEMSDLRAELVAMNLAQPPAGTFSADELADLRNEVRAIDASAHVSLSEVPSRPFTEPELRDLRRLAHEYQVSRTR